MGSASMKIMIVDDDAIDRERYRRYLNESGYEDITEFSTAHEALQAIRKNPSYECILLDYRMPQMDGLTFVKSLYEVKGFSPILIMLTGEGNEYIASDSIKNGAHGYLIKGDLSSQKLDETIQTAKIALHESKMFREKRDATAQFAYLAAHDLKSPLRTISTMNQELLEHLEKISSPSSQIRSFIDSIQSNCDYASTLIEGLLSYAQSGQTNQPFEKVDLNTLLQGVRHNLHARITQTHATLDFPNDLPTIEGENLGLRQIFQNIIDNAIKFTDKPNPTVSIDANKREDGLWVIKIQDNGIGIKERFRKEIFKPLRRLNASSRFEGTGLGLASCKKIIERHRGDIWVDSEFGGGTTFFIALPETQPEKMQA